MKNELKQLQTSEAWLREESARAVELWFLMQSANVYAALYLYFRRGALTVAESTPEGFELATGQRISPASTIEQARQWVYSTARRLPCLPEDVQ